MRRFLESVSLALKLLEASRTLRYESTTGEIWRDRGRGKALHTRCGDRRRQSAKTQKRTSKEFRERFGHTPLSAGEEIPWGGKRLLIGTGANGALPVMDEVLAEAKRRGIEVIAASTLEACQLLEEVKKGQAYAILHCTC